MATTRRSVGGRYADLAVDVTSRYRNLDSGVECFVLRASEMVLAKTGEYMLYVLAIFGIQFAMSMMGFWIAYYIAWRWLS